MKPTQAVTIVSSGGTPVQLADQRGAPYPTTGYGALVWNTGPYLIDPYLVNPKIIGVIEGTAPIDSPIFTGDPQVPTPPTGDDDSSIPNTEWVQNEIDIAIAAIPPPGPGDVAGWPFLPLAGGTLTGQLNSTTSLTSVSTPALNIQQTWNNAATLFTGMMFNAVDTASASNSVLAHWMVNGLSRAYFNKAGSLGLTGNVAVGASGLYYWTGRSVLTSPADGQIRLTNQAQTDFSRLMLGGTTTAFPAIKKNTGPAINFRDATDVNDIDVTFKTQTAGNNTTLGATTAFVTSAVSGLSTVYQPLDTGLTALASAAPGIITNTSTDTFTSRTITGTANRVVITNGNGVAGNPTINIDSAFDAALANTYLPLVGGTLTAPGNLTMPGKLTINTGTGSSSVPKMLGTDNSSNIASTAWVRDLFATRGQGDAVYVYAGNTVVLTTDPGAGNFRVQNAATPPVLGTECTFSISCTDADSVTRYLMLFQPGDSLIVTNEFTPVDAYARYDLNSYPVAHPDAGSPATAVWVTFTANFIDSKGIITPVVGTRVKITGYLNTATGDGPILGVAAGYGLTGGGVAGNVELDVDNTVIAPLNSPVFTGNPTAPTPLVADNDASIATTKFVKDQGYLTTADVDATYVNVTGDTMTGPLVGTSATFSSNIITNGGYVMIDRTGDAAGSVLHIRSDPGQVSQIALSHGTAGVNRWSIFKNGTAEGGANSGSNLQILSYDDAGATLATAISITRSSSAVILAGSLTGTTATFSNWVKTYSSSAIPAGGTLGAGYTFSSTANFGVGFGSGLPDKAWARGSLYLRSDTGTPYYNTDGTAGGWGALATAASLASYLPLAGGTLTGALTGTSAAFSGEITAATPATADNDTTVATTAFVKAQGYATTATLGNYLPLAGGTLTGALTGTSATFTDANYSIQRTGADTSIGVLFSGATKGVRFGFNASGTTIEGVDNTGVGSIQPLYLSGSSINVIPTLNTASIVSSNNITTNAGYVMVDRAGDAVTAGLYMRSDVGQNAVTYYQSGSLTRWATFKNGTAEGGSNAGSDFQISAYDDAGVAMSTPIAIKRSSGYVLLGSSSTPAARLHVYGLDQIGVNYDPAGSQGATVYVHGSGTAAGTGGAVMFGDGFGPFAAIKSYAVSGTGPLGFLSLSMRKLGTDPAFTETSRFNYDGTFSQYGTIRTHTSTAVPVGGTLGAGVMFSSTANFGIHFGSGLPDKAAARGSWYMRSDATAETGFYVNTDGTAGGWVAGGSGVPPGAIMDFAGAAPPAGWLLCQGQSVTVAAYPNLHAAIGYAYGGSGANFNVPDLGGRVTAGKETTATRLTVGGSGISGSTLGAAGGTQTHVLVANENAGHVHDISSHGHSLEGVGAHSHSSDIGGGTTWMTTNSGQGVLSNWAGGGNTMYYSNVTESATLTGSTAASNQPNTGSSGSGVAHQNTQPTIIMNKIIKV